MLFIIIQTISYLIYLTLLDLLTKYSQLKEINKTTKMVAVQKIFIAITASSTLVSAACWNVSLKVRGLGNILERGKFISFYLSCRVI